MYRRSVALSTLVLALAALGCPAHRRTPVGDEPVPRDYGLYKGVYEESGERSRRFRLLLWAEMPDRLHAEVLPPVGGPELILDGGAGRLSVALTRERTAWVGESDEEAMERVLGLPLGLDALVAALLEGTRPPEPVRLSRSPGAGHGLPESFAVEFDGRRLHLRLRRRQRGTRYAPAAGTGSPPPGLEVRPLEDLGSAGGPVFLRGQGPGTP